MSGITRIQSGYSDTNNWVNVAGGIISVGLEAIVYSEERRTEAVLETIPISPDRATIRRTIEIELLMDPMQMRATHRWLGEKIEEYEIIFGHIPSPEEVQDRARRHPQQ